MLFRIIFLLIYLAIAWYMNNFEILHKGFLFVGGAAVILFIDFYLVQKVRFYKILTVGVILSLFSLFTLVTTSALGITVDISVNQELANNLVLYFILAILFMSINYGESATYFRKKLQDGSDGASPYYVDTSAIIDGRLRGICESGFLTNSLIIPEFVVRELQLISDSSNHEKRKKGRRGLDILRNMKESDTLSVNIPSLDYDFLKGVDNKLLHLAKETKGHIITTDYNLYKVAQVEGTKVLNINAIATVLKSNYNIGDKIKVQISKKGNNKNQGVGYMEDDTMVVIEEGEKFIGQTKTVQVTSYVQSVSGKMLFCKIL